MATLFGEVLRDLGLLSKGDVIVKNPSDFIGSVLGESYQKTVAILDAAVGKVLVIDEAYGLFSAAGVKDPYKVNGFAEFNSFRKLTDACCVCFRKLSSTRLLQRSRYELALNACSLRDMRLL